MTLLASGAAAVWSRPGADRLPRLDPDALRSGDLVFRVGTGWRADAVRLLSRGPLSHVGIVVVERDGVHVVHAAPPEGNDLGGVVEQSLAQFASPAEASGVVAYRRVDIDRTADDRVAAAARGFARRRVPFDDRFDLGDRRAVYCTELVLRASAQAGVPLGRISVSRVPGGVFAGTYVLPQDLLASHRLARVAG